MRCIDELVDALRRWVDLYRVAGISRVGADLGLNYSCNTNIHSNRIIYRDLYTVYSSIFLYKRATPSTPHES